MYTEERYFWDSQYSFLTTALVQDDKVIRCYGKKVQVEIYEMNSVKCDGNWYRLVDLFTGWYVLIPLY